MEVVEPAKDFLLLGIEPFDLQADFEFQLQAKGQERAKYVTAYRFALKKAWKHINA